MRRAARRDTGEAAIVDALEDDLDALEDDICNERIEKVDGLASCSPPRWRPICP